MPKPPKPLDCIIDCLDPITEDDLRNVEADLDAILPASYKRFLLRCNGGHMNKRNMISYRVREPTRWINCVWVNGLHGVIADYPERAEDLSHRLWEIPNENRRLLSIASAYEITYMVIDGADYGAIYAHDAGHFDDFPEYYLAAEDFDEWLQLLKFDDGISVRYRMEETLSVFQAVELGDLEELTSYLDNGGQVDSRNERGESLLMAAAGYRWLQMVQVLLTRGADLEARDNAGLSPLAHAIKCYGFDITRLFLERGAKLPGIRLRGMTVLEYAKERWSFRAMQLLKEYGAV